MTQPQDGGERPKRTSEAARRALSDIEREGLSAWTRSPQSVRAAAVSGFASAGLLDAAAILVRAGAVAAHEGLAPHVRRARLAELEDDFLHENHHYRARLDGQRPAGRPARA